jgi:hypothetical protein
MGLWFTFFLRQGMVASLGVAVLLLPMLPLAMHDGWSRLHDVWAGQLIGASLASRALGFRRGSVVLAALALSIRELALGYVLLMAAFAFYERRRREAIAWVIVIAAFMAGLVAHAAAASRVITDEAIAPNWVALGGWCFVLRASRAYFALFFTPTWINAMAVAAALVGFTQWAGATGRRAGLTVAGYLAGFMILGLPVNWYWGLLIAPILPLGLMGWLMTELGPEE